MPRSLPSHAEALRILTAKRARPPRRAPPAAGRSLTKLIKALDERFGQGPVRRAATGQSAAKAAHARRRRAQPLDAGLEAELEAGLDPLAEGPLKTALRRL